MPIRTNGAVATGTRQNLIAGVRSSPMSIASVDAVFTQVTEFTQSLCDQYESTVARGEVGENGSGVADDSPILGQRPSTALLYGRVQSGKTAAMVLASALALDNGFRVVVVLTADNIELVRQTANRFRDLEGPRVLSTLDGDEHSEWRSPETVDDDYISEIAEEGLVFVCSKNYVRLPEVLGFLQRIRAQTVPSLIFDDEADAATPDTTLKARSTGARNAPTFASTIHRNIIDNTRPGEEGQSALEMLPHGIYVQVTASPFVLLLQRQSTTLYPASTFLLEPGSGYCGGEQFFGSFNVEAVSQPDPPLILVSDRETQLTGPRIPPALALSVEYTIVAAAAFAHSNGRWPSEGFKHLSHTSAKQDQHTLFAEHIDRHLSSLKRELRRSLPQALVRLGRAYRELQRSLTTAPSLNDLVPLITGAVNQAQVFIVNADSERPAYGPRVNYLVGGNILGRGLTINNLIVTYYLRQSQVSQLDTVLQHARMYGYRSELMAYTRVFLPRLLASLFQQIHQSEESLRAILGDPTTADAVPIRVPRGSRATRPSALETGALRVYEGTLSQVAPVYAIEDSIVAEEVRDLLNAANVPLSEADRERRATKIPLTDFRRLIELLEPVSDDPGRWSVDAALGIVGQYASAYGDAGTVYVRKFEERPDEERRRARLSGPEVSLIRRASPNAPVLALLYWEDPDAPELWYPTLVFPANHPTFVFAPV